MAEACRHAQRQLGRGEVGRGVELEARDRRVAGGDRVVVHRGPEALRLAQEQRRALVVGQHGLQHVRARVVAGRLLSRPRGGEPAALRVADLDLDPGVLRVEHAAREPVAGALVAGDDLEGERLPGHDLRAVGRQRARAVGAIAAAMSRLAAPRSIARTASTWAASPRIAASHVLPPAKRCDRSLPSLDAASPSGAAASGMWHVRHSACSIGSSTRAAWLPA